MAFSRDRVVLSYECFRWAVALLFATAGLSKLIAELTTASIWAREPLFAIGLYVVSLAEINLAACLLVYWRATWPLNLLAALTLAFSAYLWLLDRMLEVPAESCGCFGKALRLPLGQHLVLNGLVLISLASMGVVVKRFSAEIAR
jgi:hypothetical protein